jgi:hypothetical protein
MTIRQRMIRAAKATGYPVEQVWVAPRPGNFNPVGTMWHHTAGAYPGDLSVVTRGRSDLPGPLCNFYIAPNGVIFCITDGVANHAGRGVFYPLGISENDGNNQLFGIEISSLGTEPIKGAAYDSSIKLSAALAKEFGWNEQSVLSHKDYTPRKIDVLNSTLKIRADVKALLTSSPPVAKGEVMRGWFCGSRESIFSIAPGKSEVIWYDNVIRDWEAWRRDQKRYLVAPEAGWITGTSTIKVGRGGLIRATFEKCDAGGKTLEVFTQRDLEFNVDALALDGPVSKNDRVQIRLYASKSNKHPVDIQNVRTYLGLIGK